jgi:hypothetical protein
MASTITAGNATNGLALSCDNTGILELKTGTGSGTTAVTIGTGQQVAVTLGSAAAPSITFSGDANTGIFSPAADTIAFAEGGVESARIDSSGNLLVGTTSVSGSSRFRVVSADRDFRFGQGVGPSNVFTAYIGMANSNGLAIEGTVTSAVACVQFYNPNGAVGSIVTSGSSTAYNTSSDYRLKENIQPMTGALARVAALQPCTYVWKEGGEIGEGFIAHELAEVVPDAVSGEKDAVNEDGSIKPQGIDTSFLVATLTAAIQEQQQMIETLQAEVAALKGA